MKIKILTIKTIGLRCPDLAIDFPNKKNIHFLQMPNGTGKTTLINLIKNTLSNSWRNVNSFKSKDSKKSYGQFIIQLQIISEEIEDKITSDESSWRKPGEHSSGPLSCYDDEDNRERKKKSLPTSN